MFTPYVTYIKSNLLQLKVPPAQATRTKDTFRINSTLNANQPVSVFLSVPRKWILMPVRIIDIEPAMVFACLNGCLFGPFNPSVCICIDSVVVFSIIPPDSEERHCHTEVSTSSSFFGNIVICKCAKCGGYRKCLSLRRMFKLDV